MKTKLSTIGISITVATLMFSGCSVAIKPLNNEEINASIQKSMTDLKKIEEPIEGPLSLDDAITRAVKNNRDRKVKELEAEFRKKELSVTEQGMWPTLNAQGAYTHRSNVLGSRSSYIADGRQTYDYSTSTDDNLRTAEARISWNALDFGLSYVRAQQDADKVLIANEERRKVEYQIEQDVREAYWKAVSAQNLLVQINPVIESVTHTIDSSKKIEESMIGNMTETLGARREMLDILISLNNLKRDLLTAKPRLAMLMGLSPDTQFQLSGHIEEDKFQREDLNITKMEEVAFSNRPELMQNRYQERIGLKETKAAMLSLLPGISFDAGTNYTSNSYTYNNTWYDYGLHINMNLMKVFGYKSLKEKVDANLKIVQEQQKAIGMAVLTQVHLANIRYQEALDQWEATNQYYNVTRRISEITAKANENLISSKQQVARDQLSKLIAQVKRDMAYAELQNSYGNLFLSMGLQHNSPEFKQVITSVQRVKMNNDPLLKEMIQSVLHNGSEEKLVFPVGERRDYYSVLRAIQEGKGRSDANATTPTNETVAHTVNATVADVNSSQSVEKAVAPVVHAVIPPVVAKVEKKVNDNNATKKVSPSVAEVNVVKKGSKPVVALDYDKEREKAFADLNLNTTQKQTPHQNTQEGVKRVVAPAPKKDAPKTVVTKKDATKKDAIKKVTTKKAVKEDATKKNKDHTVVKKTKKQDNTQNGSKKVANHNMNLKVVD